MRAWIGKARVQVPAVIGPEGQTAVVSPQVLCLGLKLSHYFYLVLWNLLGGGLGRATDMILTVLAERKGTWRTPRDTEETRAKAGSGGTGESRAEEGDTFGKVAQRSIATERSRMCF